MLNRSYENTRNTARCAGFGIGPTGWLGRRSAFVRELIERGRDDERRWADIEAALGGIEASGHERDENPGEWVRHQRQGDNRRSV